LGSLGRMNPPLRTADDVNGLWDNLDAVDCLATDHAPHTLEEKESPSPPSGVPGLETALSLMISRLWEKDRPQSLCEVSRLMAAGPTRIYSLEKKGAIRVGCDADLSLVDPSATWTIGEQPWQTKCGWSPFSGHPARGRLARVLLRGRDVYLDGRVLAEPGYGQMAHTAS